MTHIHQPQATRFEEPAEGVFVFPDLYPQAASLIARLEALNDWVDPTRVKEDQEIPDHRYQNTVLHFLDFQESHYQSLLAAVNAAIKVYQDHFELLSLSDGERFQVSKYMTGGFCETHADAAVEHDRLVSTLIYLNDDFEGGELYFPRQDLLIKPKTGTVILFPSNFMFIHQSRPVISGEKYIVVSWMR